MKKTLMVTGATGFIGSGFIEKYQDKYNIISVDLIKKKPCELDFTGVDCVLHLAALVHQRKGIPREKYFEVNTYLTEDMAREAKNNGVKHFVFYSTVSVYGTHGCIDRELILDENSHIAPKSPYAESKWEAEKILENLKNTTFKISILRPPMVYGENCPGNMRKLEKLVKIFPILPFNYEKNKRTLVRIDELLQFTSNIIDNEKEGVAIPRDENNVSIKEIIKSLAEKNNKKIILIKLPQIIFKILLKIKPEIMESLYGSLCFK